MSQTEAEKTQETTYKREYPTSADTFAELSSDDTNLDEAQNANKQLYLEEAKKAQDEIRAGRPGLLRDLIMRINPQYGLPPKPGIDPAKAEYDHRTGLEQPGIDRDEQIAQAVELKSQIVNMIQKEVVNFAINFFDRDRAELKLRVSNNDNDDVQAISDLLNYAELEGLISNEFITAYKVDLATAIIDSRIIGSLTNSDLVKRLKVPGLVASAIKELEQIDGFLRDETAQNLEEELVRDCVDRFVTDVIPGARGDVSIALRYIDDVLALPAILPKGNVAEEILRMIGALQDRSLASLEDSPASLTIQNQQILPRIFQKTLLDQSKILDYLVKLSPREDLANRAFKTVETFISNSIQLAAKDERHSLHFALKAAEAFAAFLKEDVSDSVNPAVAERLLARVEKTAFDILSVAGEIDIKYQKRYEDAFGKIYRGRNAVKTEF